MVITPIRGLITLLITTQEPPSRGEKALEAVSVRLGVG